MHGSRAAFRGFVSSTIHLPLNAGIVDTATICVVGCLSGIRTYSSVDFRLSKDTLAGAETAGLGPKPKCSASGYRF